MISRIEFSIAGRYLRSRRGSRLLSFITVIAIGGITVGVSALIVIMGVMNGLQTDLRDKILVGSPDLRVLSYGDELIIKHWPAVLERVQRQPGVVAVAPFVLTTALVKTEKSNYIESAQVAGILAAGTRGANVTTIREHADPGAFRFATADGKRRGAVLGKLLSQRLNATIGSSITLFSAAGKQINPVTGMVMPRVTTLEVTGVFDTGMYEYDDKYIYMSIWPLRRRSPGWTHR